MLAENTDTVMRRKEMLNMKKLNIKIKPETAVSVALGILGIAQMLLTNKKDANDKAQLKEEILTEVLKETTSETK